ncbi:MAG: phage major capsid protein [Acidiferrobacteraceae bacterium]
MAELSLEQINDLLLGTLKELGRNRFQQIAQNLQRYPVISRWFRKNKVQFDEGLGIQRNLMISLSNQARHTGVLTTDSADIPSLMAQLAINWRHAQNAWAFAYQEILTNRGKALVYNVIQPRRTDCMISLAEELENKAWTLAPSGDTTLPWGLPFWIVYAASAAPGSFAGGYPSGYTTMAGIDLTAAPNFKNYSCTFSNVTKNDLINSMRAAHRKIGWFSPVNVQDYRKGEYGDLQLYVDEQNLRSFETVGESQNENLGRDLAPFGGAEDVKYVEATLTFRRHPIRWVPQLDNTAVFTAATHPVYMIDHATFYPVCLAGDYLRESPVLRAPTQHNVFRVFVDLTYNYLCVDRRRNAVFSN